MEFTINSVVIIDEQHILVKENVSCSKCFLHNNRKYDCKDYPCVPYARKDNKNVGYVSLNEKLKKLSK